MSQLKEKEGRFGYGFKHPECGEDEVFLTNMTALNFQTMEVKGKRLGQVAYHLATQKPYEGIFLKWIFPVFVPKEYFSNRQ